MNELLMNFAYIDIIIDTINNITTETNIQIITVLSKKLPLLSITIKNTNPIINTVKINATAINIPSIMPPKIVSHRHGI